MKLRHIAIAAIISAAACGATAQNIATPKVKADFKERQEKVANPAYFTVFDRNLTPQQREALEFLYAYMPLPDIADYSGDFFLTNVDATLRARNFIDILNLTTPIDYYFEGDTIHLRRR